jgi:hypothetical protein
MEDGTREAGAAAVSAAVSQAWSAGEEALPAATAAPSPSVAGGWEGDRPRVVPPPLDAGLLPPPVSDVPLFR